MSYRFFINRKSNCFPSFLIIDFAPKKIKILIKCLIQIIQFYFFIKIILYNHLKILRIKLLYSLLKNLNHFNKIVFLYDLKINITFLKLNYILRLKKFS